MALTEKGLNAGVCKTLSFWSRWVGTTLAHQYRGECFKVGEAVSKTAWVGSIPNRPCHIPH